MHTEMRAAVFRIVLAVGVMLVAIASLSATIQGALAFWLVAGPLVLLVAAARNLELRTFIGSVTFVPLATMIGLFALGRDLALVSLTIGSLLGSVFYLATRPSNQSERSLIRLADECWSFGHNGLSLLLAALFYQVVSGTLPLTAIPTPLVAAEVMVSLFAYLFVYNILLLFDMILRGVNIIDGLREARRTLIGVQVLPIGLAPLAALTLWQVGPIAFDLFCIIILTIAIVVFLLNQTRTRLQEQIQQLRAFSAMHRALRSSLELGSLLQNVYLQNTNLIKSDNLHVLLRHPEESAWHYSLAMEAGRSINLNPIAEPVDLVGWVLDEQRPLLLSDASKAPRTEDKTINSGSLKLPQGAQSWMGVPIIASDRLLGCMVTWLDESEQSDRRFNELDFDLFMAIAVQTGVALENALLYEASAQQAERLSQLNELNAALNASLDLQRVFELIAESVIEFAGSDKAAVYLDRGEAGGDQVTLELVHAEGFSQGYEVRPDNVNLPFSEVELSMLTSDAKSVSISDINAENGSVSRETRLLSRQEDFVAYAYVPLAVQNRTMGVIAIYFAQPHSFGQTELELLGAFANQAAQAIENARLYNRIDVQLSRRIGQIDVDANADDR